MSENRVRGYERCWRKELLQVVQERADRGVRLRMGVFIPVGWLCQCRRRNRILR